MANPFPEPPHGKESSASGRRTVLGGGSEEKLPRGSTITVKQGVKLGPPTNPGLQTKSRKVARRLLPHHGPVCRAYAAQIVEAPQHPMGTLKPTYHHHQPVGHQPRGQQTVRIHPCRGAPEALLSHLPTAKTHKQCPYDRTDRVLAVGNQLDRQQRKSPGPSPAQKAHNRNALLFKAWKQLNGITPVGGSLSIIVGNATDRAGRSNNGEKIDLTLKKRFFVLPNRLESVRVGKLNFSAALLTRGRVFRLHTVGTVSL
jgi:hypothetical protein